LLLTEWMWVSAHNETGCQYVKHNGTEHLFVGQWEGKLMLGRLCLVGFSFSSLTLSTVVFLGPLLFNIYMNHADFFKYFMFLKILCRWHYRVLFEPLSIHLENESTLQNNLDLLVSWFCKNLLAINHSKSQPMVFNRVTLPTSFDIDSNQLDYVLQIKLLRVMIDNSLLLKHIFKKFVTKWI